MKIGIIFSLYGCENYMDRCLSPWIKLRKELNLVLTGCNGMYNDFLRYGFRDRSHKSLIKAIGKDLDFLITTTGDHLWDEQNSKNYLWNYLKDRDVDLIWIVDGDEFYTEEEIKSVIDFVVKNPDPDAYAVQFRNYTIKIPYWTEGFYRETLYWTKRNGGILDFHFDVFVRYNNGKTINETKNFIKIPKKIAYIEHYSWLSDDPRIPEKVVYQNGRFAGEDGERCSFEYDSKNGLSFNKKFWNSRNLEVPILHETLGIHCTDFDLSFSRKNRNIDILNVCEDVKYEFIVYSPEEEIIYHSVLSLSPGINYFIYPGNYPDFNFFRVCVYFNGNKIHDEKLHLEI
jgi:hypothetical protein